MATQPQGTVHSGQLSQSALDDLLSLGVGEVGDPLRQTKHSLFVEIIFEALNI